jgi:hypothetical protein
MADNQIEIGFSVANDDLKSGLSQAAQSVGDACGDIQEALDKVRTSALEASQPLKTLAQQPDSRKSIEDDFAAQVSQIDILKDLNQISADDAIADQMRVENARYASLRAQLDAAREAMGEEADARQNFQAQADNLEAKHNAKLRALDQQAVKETEASWKSIIDPIGNAFSSSINGIIQGNETLSQAMAKLGQSVVSDFVNMAVKRATAWIESELTMTSASEAGNAARLASSNAAALEGKAADAAAGSASVFGDANKAAAGAYAATADIPVVGPVLAPVAAAGAFAAVMAFDVFSAAGGWDVPGGLNPMTQLHEREMVLPASIAEPLRANLAGGGGKSGGDIHIHAVDAASFQRLLSNNKSGVSKALRAAARGFDPALSA